MMVERMQFGDSPLVPKPRQSYDRSLLTMRPTTPLRSRDLSDSGSYKLVPQVEGQDEDISPHRWCNAAFAAPCSHPIAPSNVDTFFEPERIAASPQEFLETPLAQGITVLLIVSNAIIIGFETDMPDLLPWGIIENGFLAAFTLELLLKLTLQGPSAYFQCRHNPDIAWNIFDLSIVSFGIFNVIVETLIGGAGKMGKDATIFRMIRLLRILRVLRIIRIVRFLKQLYLLAYGFIEGTMAVFWVTLLASFALYICSVVLVRTYGRITEEEDENYHFFQEHFGNIGRTMFNLFELLAAPDLVPYRAIMFEYPPLVFFLVTFIVLGSFGVNGLLVALINESILEKNQARLEADRLEREAKRKLMQKRCQEVFDSVDVNGNRVLPRNEIMKCKGQIVNLFEEFGVNFRSHDLDQMVYIMDFDDTGIIERSEFVQGVVELCDQIRPMSIMELHCQVSKCASKLENCDNKMDSVGKALENIHDKDGERIEKADKLVRRLMDAVEKIEKAPPLDMQQVPSAQQGFTLPTVAEIEASTWKCEAGASKKSLRELLVAEQQRLAVTQGLIDALLKSRSGDLARTPSAELANLGNALFRLQHSTHETLEALFTTDESAFSSEPNSTSLSSVATRFLKRGVNTSSPTNAAAREARRQYTA